MLLTYSKLVHQFLWHDVFESSTYWYHCGPVAITSWMTENAITPSIDGVSLRYRWTIFETGVYSRTDVRHNWRITLLAHKNPLNRKNASTHSWAFVMICSKNRFSPSRISKILARNFQIKMHKDEFYRIRGYKYVSLFLEIFRGQVTNSQHKINWKSILNSLTLQQSLLDIEIYSLKITFFLQLFLEIPIFFILLPWLNGQFLEC